MSKYYETETDPYSPVIVEDLLQIFLGVVVELHRPKPYQNEELVKVYAWRFAALVLGEELVEQLYLFLFRAFEDLG